MFSLLHEFTKVFQEGRYHIVLDADTTGLVTRQCKGNVKIYLMQVSMSFFGKMTINTELHERCQFHKKTYPLTLYHQIN